MDSTTLRTQPDEYWREQLTPEQYSVCRLGATERPFSGALYHNHTGGTYACVACHQPLFSSTAKFDSGSGWPSFDDPIARDNVELREDRSHGMVRTEALCKNCGAHLGHVFDDGPRETTGLRYCINSIALDFQARRRLRKIKRRADGYPSGLSSMFGGASPAHRGP